MLSTASHFDCLQAGGNVVLGPGFAPAESSAKPVTEVVIPNDSECLQTDEACASRKRNFVDIADRMTDCRIGTDSFLRQTDAGGIEMIHISFAPVQSTFLDPPDSSDFSRGAFLRSDACVYSLALAETDEGIKEPFRSVEDDVEQQIRIAVGCLAVVIAGALLAAFFVSYYVARSVTEPMIGLLEGIRSIGKKNADNNIPKLDKSTGSKEILNVSNTMETLVSSFFYYHVGVSLGFFGLTLIIAQQFEVVQFANTAFYGRSLTTLTCCDSHWNSGSHPHLFLVA